MTIEKKGIFERLEKSKWKCIIEGEEDRYLSYKESEFLEAAYYIGYNDGIKETIDEFVREQETEIHEVVERSSQDRQDEDSETNRK